MGGSLLRLKALGINTIDLYPLWNWQQPAETVLDFDGRTNPRRDLRYLLRLIELMDFKLTFRPGPYFTDEWRNGGYPIGYFAARNMACRNRASLRDAIPC